MENKWLDWAKELQFIAQAGLTYSKDPFDLERFARIREISAEEKNNEEQVRMCFRAAEDPNWKVLFK